MIAARSEALTCSGKAMLRRSQNRALVNPMTRGGRA